MKKETKGTILGICHLYVFIFIFNFNFNLNFNFFKSYTGVAFDFSVVALGWKQHCLRGGVC
jgi:hypothetical protein